MALHCAQRLIGASQLAHHQRSFESAQFQVFGPSGLSHSLLKYNRENGKSSCSRELRWLKDVNCAERSALRQRDQPRQQYAAAALESESAPCARFGEWRAQATSRLHCLHPLRPRAEGRLISRRLATSEGAHGANFAACLERSGSWRLARRAGLQETTGARSRTSGLW